MPPTAPSPTTLPPPGGLADADRRPRLAWLDAARGAAVVAMVVYHASWDLSVLQVVDLAVPGEPGWNAFARLVAGSFLILSGLALGLAHPGATRLGAFARRLAILAAAAGLVSLVTAFAFPDSWVFFGILHNMTVSSLVALPFLRAGPVASLAGAPTFGLAGLLTLGPAFDAPPLVILGLGRPPMTNDWVPIVPWTGLLLAGVAGGLLIGRRAPDRHAARRVPILGAIGRHSLAIYLLHQPILYGGLSAYVAVAGRDPSAEAAPFRSGCARSCEAVGRSRGRCAAACACTIDGLRRAGAWPRVAANRLDPGDSQTILTLARNCLESDTTPPETP